MKLKRRSLFSESKQKTCAFPGCEEPAEFRGPTRDLPASLIKRLYGAEFDPLADCLDRKPGEANYYCQQHIREINKNWNFFANMSAEEIAAFERDALTGHRITLESLKRISRQQERLDSIYQQADTVRTGRQTQPSNPNGNVARRPTSEEHEAISILSVTLPISREELKLHYRKLVKQHHPDSKAEKDKKSAEARLKRINHAYHILKAADGLLAPS